MKGRKTSMINAPLVSVIIPTYKRDVELLNRAIQSVLNQTYKNIEIIIVDDNGNPELFDYRENINKYFSFLSSNKNIKLIVNDCNLGGALARNKGILEAKGTLITFLDDDDYYLSNKVLNQVNFMLKNSLNCSFTDLYIYNEKDELIDVRERTDIESFEVDYLWRYHLTKTISGTETFMATKELLLNVGCFDDVPMGQEFYLMCKILNYSNLRIGYYQSNDIKAYRTDDESISNSPNKIPGEKKLYKFRKGYFYLLSRSERRYIKCRHRAVMAVSYKRRKNTLLYLLFLIAAFFSDPCLCYKEGRRRKHIK